MCRVEPRNVQVADKLKLTKTNKENRNKNKERNFGDSRNGNWELKGT
jgi:hypothetical protein